MSQAPDQDRRTHKPTPRRVREFRKRGEIALSKELTSAATMAAGVIVGLVMAARSAGEVTTFFRQSFSGLAGGDGATFGDAIRCVGRAGLPVAAGAVGGWLISSAVQLGWPPALVSPRFDLSRLASPDALLQLLSPKAMMGRLWKPFLKMGFVGLACALAVRAELHRFAASPALEAGALATRLGASALRLGGVAGAAFAVLAAIDYLLARRAMGAKMRMTPDELRREMRESEGDPAIRRKRRQRMRELSRRRLPAAVKGADVVIVNPTHYAVALRYRSEKDRAPRVVAKGRDAQAQRIRDLARAAGVPIVEKPPLARLLHKIAPEGREIPAPVYQAVAEVLAYVYRLKRRRR